MTSDCKDFTVTVHYVLPSGMGVDHLLFEGGGSYDDGNGREPDGSGNGNGKKSGQPLALSPLNKIRTCGSGVSDENPGENSVSGFCGHDEIAPRCGAYRKPGKNGWRAADTARKRGIQKSARNQADFCCI